MTETSRNREARAKTCTWDKITSHDLESDYSPLFRLHLAYCAQFWAPQWKKKDFDKLEQIKEKTINGARGKDAPGVASQLCLFSLQLRQEHNGHSQLLNRELQGTRVTIFSQVHYRKVRGNQKVQKRSF